MGNAKRPEARTVAAIIEAHGGVHRGTAMWVTTLKERPDVDRMLDARVPHRVICQWLAEDCGYGKQATMTRIKAYTVSQHRHQVAKVTP